MTGFLVQILTEDCDALKYPQFSPLFPKIHLHNNPP